MRGLKALLAGLLVFKLSLKGHRFEPARLSVPAGQKFELVVTNEDAQPAEFESFRLYRERLIPAHSTATLYLGPLRKGVYDFFDDFHKKARGSLEAAEAKP